MALISLDEAKSYLRVDTEDEDAMIAILLLLTKPRAISGWTRRMRTP